MKTKKLNSTERFIANMILRVLSIGFVWAWVALLNPPLETNLVWLIAILFGEIQVGFYWVIDENEK